MLSRALGGVLLGGALAIGAWCPASADDRPVIIIGTDGPTPQRLDVHVGEIVSWRGAGGERLRIQLDHHAGAHEIIERHGEVRGVFRRPGEHSYVARAGDSRREARGIIVVKESLRPNVGLLECSAESSERICFDPR